VDELWALNECCEDRFFFKVASWQLIFDVYCFIYLDICNYRVFDSK
jgi:hypothetical protein